MSKTCAACKNREAVMTVSVADAETGVFSSPIPVCEDCLHRISKIRPVKITESYTPSYLKGTILGPNKTTVQSVAASAANDPPAWQRTIWRIQKIFQILFVIHFAVAIVGVLGIVTGFMGSGIPLYISIPVAIAGVAGAIGIHIFTLISEAVEQYWKSQK